MCLKDLFRLLSLDKKGYGMHTIWNTSLFLSDMLLTFMDIKTKTMWSAFSLFEMLYMLSIPTLLSYYTPDSVLTAM